MLAVVYVAVYILCARMAARWSPDATGEKRKGIQMHGDSCQEESIKRRNLLHPLGVAAMRGDDGHRARRGSGQWQGVLSCRLCFPLGKSCENLHSTPGFACLLSAPTAAADIQQHTGQLHLATSGTGEEDRRVRAQGLHLRPGLASPSPPFREEATGRESSEGQEAGHFL